MAEKPNPEIYVTNNCELQSYAAPDTLVCVTHCDVDFLKDCIHHYTENIHVIPNGINDVTNQTVKRKNKSKIEKFHCLYVGVVSESKGVLYVLNALRLVKQQG